MIKRWLRYLVWVYDGRPDPNAPPTFLRNVGWGPIRLPGERAQEQESARRARRLIRLVEELPHETRTEREFEVPEKSLKALNDVDLTYTDTTPDLEARKIIVPAVAMYLYELAERLRGECITPGELRHRATAIAREDLAMQREGGQM